MCIRDREYASILEALDLNVAIKKELSEAILAGKNCSDILQKVISHLKMAGDWGKWDMYGNKGAKYSKRRALDAAARLLPTTRHQLKLFMRELNDLGENDIQININPIQINNFTDFFFDNLISDWIVQQRIVNTINEISNSHTHVIRVVMSLEKEEELVSDKIHELKMRREQMLSD